MTDEADRDEFPTEGEFRAPPTTRLTETKPLEPLELPEPRSWPFDEPKLRRLLVAKDGHFPTLYQLADQRRGFMARASGLRTDIDYWRARGRSPSEDQLSDLSSCERRTRELQSQIDELAAKNQAMLAVATACQEWAETVHKWTEDGGPPPAGHAPLQTVSDPGPNASLYPHEGGA